MNAIPNIIVQLVHIEGPLKGEIQELTDPEIIIGRHPDCQVRFPKDVVTLSRKHARIVREGNRFKIIDESTNGTFVNGKAAAQTYLKDGDVITLSEGGPKFSFLTQVSDQPLPPSYTAPTTAPQDVPARPASAAPPNYPDAVQAPPPSAPPAPPRPAPDAFIPPPPRPPMAAPAGPAVQSVKAPFAIQYGPALKSFQTLPITLGKGPRCDFVINHPAMNDQQAQIFFAQDQYWIKDLTGTGAITINGTPIAGQAPLQPDAQLSLSQQGPRFRFLGGGRLAEVEDPLPDIPTPTPVVSESISAPKQETESIGQKAGTLFKKFFT
jgi:pSer/pThr/pTyr-binding forkhead associated (FHA) protein